jgi:hypothetical protein
VGKISFKLSTAEFCYSNTTALIHNKTPHIIQKTTEYRKLQAPTKIIKKYLSIKVSNNLVLILSKFHEDELGKAIHCSDYVEMSTR